MIEIESKRVARVINRVYSEQGEASGYVCYAAKMTERSCVPALYIKKDATIRGCLIMSINFVSRGLKLL